MQMRSLAAAGVVGALAIAGCGNANPTSKGAGPAGGGSAGNAAAVTSGHYGGTLYVLMHNTMTSAADTLEPATSNAQESQDMLPLFFSPLTVYVPGSNPTRIAGDLATNGGVASHGARVWTFHIRKGITYSYGPQVTSYDVKYAVERGFESSLAGGPCGPSLDLVGAKNFKGPVADPHGLPSIATPNASTISFHLTQPNYDFNFTTTYPCFAGVPKAKDTGTTYGQHPVTSGPYDIQSFQGGKRLVLVRNPKWKRGLVPTIKAYPDKIVYELGLDPSVIDQRLINDQGSDQSAIDTDSTIQASDVAQVLNNPQVATRKATITLGANEYMLFMDVNKAPFTNPLVRQAMQYAVDKQSFQTATGGPIAGGPIAHDLLGPGILGYHSSYDPYPAPATGDPAKAKQLLKKAGYNHAPITVEMPGGSPQDTNQATAIKAALTAAGFNVNLQVVNEQAYYPNITTPKTVPQVNVTLLGGAFDDAGQVLNIYDGTLLTPSGPNYDLSQLNDPTINKMIHTSEAAPSAQAAAPLWDKVDHAVMRNASVVPIINESKIYLHGSNVHGEIVSNVYGAPTLFDISVGG